METSYYIDCLKEGKRLYTNMLGSAKGLNLHRGEIGWLESHGGPNYIFDIDITGEGADQRVNELIASIKQGTMPGYILISALSKPDNLAEIFQANGFTVNRDEGSGMAMDLSDAIQQVQIPAHLCVAPVQNKNELRIWVDIVSRALFGREVIKYEQYHDIFLLPNVTMNLGSVDGVPAATSLVIYSEGKKVATVEQISTLEEYRHRGLGTAITVASLQKMAARGVKTAVLQATKMGENIYRNIGFISYHNKFEIYLDK